MSNETLFPEEDNEEALKADYRREKTLQQELMEFLREGKIVNEEIYNKVLGGRSLTATVRNCEQRGMLEEGEYIYPYWVYDKAGEKIRHFKLVRAYTDEELEQMVEKRVSERLKASELLREHAKDIFETPPSKLSEVPAEFHVDSIYVGTNKGQPEMMVVLEGVDKPVRKLLHPRDAKYLVGALSPFVKD